jgi:tRNA modification GTPase
VKISTDAIAAISTAPGRGAIAVVRLTGPEAVGIASGVYSGKEKLDRLDSHSVRYGRVFDSSGKLLDEVLIAVMRGPDSYTGEDVVEISCHGGLLASRLILNALVEAGARLAEPGEFTKRAFLNGKMDLAQAEAVAEIVAAKTRKALERALGQLEGGVSDTLRALRARVVDALAELEARIDFPDDVPEELSAANLTACLHDVASQLELVVSERTISTRLSAGARVPIVGRPNVGKSSLLNSLVGRSRAIVSSLPGTTRDTIEEEIDLDGIPVNLIDTAGLRSVGEEIEEEGVRRSKDEIRRADLVIYVVDASAQDYGPDSEILESISDKPVLVAVNKIDVASPERVRTALAASFAGHLCSAGDARKAGGVHGAGGERGVRGAGSAWNVDGVPSASRVRGAGGALDTGGVPDADTLHPRSWAASPCVFAEVSARDGTGIEPLEKELARMIFACQPDMDGARCASQRHLECLRAAIASIERAVSGLAARTPEELVAFELREAAVQMGSITGETIGPDVLDSVFSRFCVGK